MNKQDAINTLREIETDVRGRIAISVAIEALQQPDTPYCRWCDPEDETCDVQVGLMADKFNGMVPYHNPNIEYTYCPICGLQQQW